MATNETLNIIGILLGLFGATIGLGSLVFVFNSNSQASRNNTPVAAGGRGIFLSSVLFIVSLSALVVTISIYLFTSPGSRLTSIAIFAIVLFASLAGAFALIQSISQSTQIPAAKRKMQDVISTPEKLNKESEAVLQRYKQKLVQDIDVTRIQVIGMSAPVNVRDVYIKLKVRLSKKEAPQKQIDEDVKPGFKKRIENYLPFLMPHKTFSAEMFDLNPANVVARHHHCVFLGDPGSGKTTLLKSLFLQTPDTLPELDMLDSWDKRLPYLPIFVSLHSFARSCANSQSKQLNLFNFICKKLQNNESDKEADIPFYLERFMKAGMVLLLLDGLEETFIGNEPQESYKYVAGCIEEIAEDYPALHIVVTARKSAYFQRAPLSLKSIVLLEVLPFGPDDIRKFVINWCKNQPQFSASELNKKFEQIRNIREIISNPLFLIFVIFAYQNGLDPIENRALLYERCAKSFPKWDASRGIVRYSDPFLTEDDIQRLLQRVAYHFHEKKQEQFEKEDLLAEIAKFIKSDARIKRSAEEVLDLIATESGLLKKNEMGAYQFLHLRFQEYFVAKYLSKGEGKGKGLDYLIDHLDNSWWGEVVTLYAAYAEASDAHLLLQKLLDRYRNGNDLFLTPLILAGHCVAIRPDVDNEPGPTIIRNLYTTLEQVPYALTRDQAAEALVDIGKDNKNVVEALKELLPPIPPTNQTATRGDEIPLAALKNCQSIARALSKVGEPDWKEGKSALADHIYTLLESDLVSSDDVRTDVAQSLGKLDNGELNDRMKQLLSNPEKGDDLRISMAKALGYTREPDVAYDLFGMLTDGRFQDEIAILVNIIEALGRLGEYSLAPELYKLLSDRLLSESNYKLVHDNNYKKDIRRLIAESLGKLDNLEIVQDLVSLFKNSELEDEVLCGIANALSELYDKDIIPTLKDYYEDRDVKQPVRNFIATTLCRLGEGSVVGDLQELFEAGTTDYRAVEKVSSPLRQAIAAALGSAKYAESESDRSLKMLLEALEQRKFDADVRAAIVTALSKREWDEREWNKHKIVPRLLTILTAPNQKGEYEEYNVLVKVAEALGELKDSSITPKLCNMLREKNMSIGLRQALAGTVEVLASRDEEKARVKKCAESLADLLSSNEIKTKLTLADSIHHALWEVSKSLPRMRVVYDTNAKKVKVVPAQDKVGV
jgi:HEAT repeat protein